MGRRTRVEQDEIGPVRPRERPVRRGGPASPSGRRPSIVFAIFVLVALVVAAVIATALHGGGTKISAPPKHARHVVVFMVDGAGTFPEGTMPVVARLARAGTTYDRAWIGQWPSVRPASGATIGTGVFPRKHGIAGQSWRDPATGHEIQPTLPSDVRLGSIDQILEAKRLTPIAAVIKDRDPGARILAVTGLGCAPADAAASWLADYVLCIARSGNKWAESAVTGHDLPPGTPHTAPVPMATGSGLGPQVEGWQLGAQDDQIAQNAMAAIRATRPQLTIVEFPEPAAVGAFAPEARRDAVMAGLLAGIDRDIGQIEASIRADRHLASTAFVVTSTEALSLLQHRQALTSFSDAVIAAGGVPIYTHGSGAVSIAVLDARGAEAVAQAIEASRLTGIDAIFYRTHASGQWQYNPQYLDPLLHPAYGDALASMLSTAASAEAPDVVTVYAPHTGAAANIAGRRATSVSGGFSWDTQHIPLVMSGPGVVARQVSNYPARLVDLAPTVEALLGLTPVAGDGVVLADGLTSPPSGSADAQQRRGQTLSATVDILIRRLNSAG